MQSVATAHHNPLNANTPILWVLFTGIILVLSYAITAPLNLPPDHQLKMEKSSGRNDPHANQKARDKAQEEYDKVREELQQWNRKPNKTPDDKKIIEKLRKQLERLRKKKDFGGETHSRKSKGN
jgi:hypothetical protein